MKKITNGSGKGNLAHKLANNVYPIGESNEVKQQIQHAKKSKVGNRHSIVSNLIKYKIPDIKN
jgi:tRNA A58 N-methylase Trm61